jgi:hypothetical protein
MQPAKAHRLALHAVPRPSPQVSKPSAAIEMEKDGYVAAASFYTLMKANDALSFSITSRQRRTQVEISNAIIQERKETVPAKPEVPVDCRIAIPIPTGLGNEPKEIVAEAIVQGMNLTFSLEEGRRSSAVLKFMAGNFELSSCKFSMENGRLNLYSFHTHPYYRGRGLSAALQRTAHMIADTPSEVVIHDIMHTNPAYDEIAEEFLNTGTTREFDPEKLKASTERIFDARVASLGLLNDAQLNEQTLTLIKRDGIYDVALKAGTTFDLAIELYM